MGSIKGTKLELQDVATVTKYMEQVRSAMGNAQTEEGKKITAKKTFNEALSKFDTYLKEVESLISIANRNVDLLEENAKKIGIEQPTVVKNSRGVLKSNLATLKQYKSNLYK